jgi:hypothetical protein
MPRRANGFMEQFIAQLAEAVAAKLNGARSAAGAKRANVRGSRGPSPLKGKHFSAAKMRCRYPGCKNRSKGPKFSFLCEEHRKLGKRAVKAAMEKAAEKSA